MSLFALLLIQCVFAQDLVQPTKTGPCITDGDEQACHWEFYDDNKTLIVKGYAESKYLSDEYNHYVGWNEVRPDVVSVIIEEGFTELSSQAFKNCPKLTWVKFPTQMNRIEKEAFAFCTALRFITLPDGISFISDRLFQGCSSLRAITIPAYTLPQFMEIEHIRYGAFDGCSALETVVIPATVERINEAAFTGCTSLTMIEVDEENKFFTTFEGSLFSKDRKELIKYAAGKTNPSYDIPYFTKTIKPNAFHSSNNLEKVRIPGNVEAISQKSFDNCLSLTTVEYTGFDDIPFCYLAFNNSDVQNIVVPVGYKERTCCGHPVSPNQFEVSYCYDLTIKEGRSVYDACICVDNAYKSTKTTCQCEGGYSPNADESYCGRIVSCGIYTEQKGVENNIEECTCVPNAVAVEGENRCECPDGYYGDKEGKTCSKIIKCGPLTEQETNDNNTIPCSCKSHAHFYGETACVCDNGYVEVDGVCKQLLYCSYFTNERDKPETTTECTCVQNATKTSDYRCECDVGFYEDYSENKCKKLITCGELTKQYKKTNNDEECTCVDLAMLNENNVCQCVEHAKPVEGQNKCECEDRYEQSGDYYCRKKATTHTCGSQCIWKSGPYDSWVVVSGFGSISDGVEIVELGESLTSIRIVDGIETIESNVFKGLTQLETISIPASVSKIGDHAFGDCKKVNKIEFLGRSSPRTCAANAFSVSVKVSVPSDYYDDSFCGLPIEKTETPSTPENCPTDGSSNIMILFIIVLLTLLF